MRFFGAHFDYCRGSEINNPFALTGSKKKTAHAHQYRLEEAVTLGRLRVLMASRADREGF